MTDALPLVSVLVPARNEARDIERCLQAVLAQDYPGRLEIVVVDGASSDETVLVAKGVLRSGKLDWSVLTNPAATTPSNLNTGLRAARGDIVCRVDARSVIPESYVRTCAEVLCDRPDVVVVGGSQVAEPSSRSAKSLGIARALNNRYTMGGSRYRSAARSGEADTVYLGAFRRVDLISAGGWDERFPTNQDFELNRRLSQWGTIWFDERLAVGYRPRRSVAALWRQYFRFGRWKVHYWRMTGDAPQPRQMVILAGGALLPSVAAVVTSRSHHRGAVGLGIAATAVAALVTVDAAGNRSSASLLARAWSCAASISVGAGWLAGVGLEGIMSLRRRGSE